MPRFQQILGNQAAPIAKPKIFVDDDLAFRSPVIALTPVNILSPKPPVSYEIKVGCEEVPIHDKIGGMSLELACTIESDLLTSFQDNSCLQSDTTTYDIGFEAFALRECFLNQFVANFSMRRMLAR